MSTWNLMEQRAACPDELDAAHMWLVHPDGSECPDGCDAAPDPGRLALYERERATAELGRQRTGLADARERTTWGAEDDPGYVAAAAYLTKHREP